MDAIDYYNQYAKEYFENTVYIELNHILDEFIDYLPVGAEIMDLGCGSGRDSLYLMERGYDVTAVDGSIELCKLAAIHIGQDVLNITYSELNFNNVFDGVWACASLLHIPKKDLSTVLIKITKSLKSDGVLFMSFKSGNFVGMTNGRFYNYYKIGEIKEIIESIPNLSLVKISKDKDVRSGKEKDEWIHVISRKII